MNEIALAICIMYGDIAETAAQARDNGTVVEQVLAISERAWEQNSDAIPEELRPVIAAGVITTINTVYENNLSPELSKIIAKSACIEGVTSNE